MEVVLSSNVLVGHREGLWPRLERNAVQSMVQDGLGTPVGVDTGPQCPFSRGFHPFRRVTPTKPQYAQAGLVALFGMWPSGQNRPHERGGVRSDRFRLFD